MMAIIKVLKSMFVIDMSLEMAVWESSLLYLDDHYESCLDFMMYSIYTYKEMARNHTENIQYKYIPNI